jgi:hypothetical protein
MFEYREERYMDDELQVGKVSGTKCGLVQGSILAWEL